MHIVFFTLKKKDINMYNTVLVLLSTVSVITGQSTVKSNSLGVCQYGYNELVLSKLDSLIARFNQADMDEEKQDNGFPPVDCQQILDRGHSIGSGVYTIYNPVDPVQKKEVYCDMETDGGGWLVFQSRVSNSVSFDNAWARYVTGFGDVNHNFWLGNEFLHRLTYYKPQELRVDLENWENVTAYAKYQVFRVDTEPNKYKLTVSGYSGSAGDSLSYHNAAYFSTKDRDHDTHSTINCAQELQGAWWFKACEASSLNGPYYQTETIDPVQYHGVSWDTFGGNHASLKMSQMKIRPI